MLAISEKQIWTCDGCGQEFVGRALLLPTGWNWRGSRLVCPDCDSAPSPSQPALKPSAPHKSANFQPTLTKGKVRTMPAQRPWISINSQNPPAGLRVEVKHEQAPGYECTGEIDQKRRWQCDNGFLIEIHGQVLLTFQPTHWREIEQPAAC